MDFEKVIKTIIGKLIQQNIQFAVIGGFALGAWGIMRSTVDLDLLILANDMDKVDSILKESFYECVYKSENVSQYVSDLKPLGQIDILHAFRDTSISIIKRAKKLKAFDRYEIPVAIPEDIIGLKLQALANDKSREDMEYFDIDMILKYLNEGEKNVDWDLLKEYFSLFNFNEKYKYFRRKYSK